MPGVFLDEKTSIFLFEHMYDVEERVSQKINTSWIINSVLFVGMQKIVDTFIGKICRFEQQGKFADLGWARTSSSISFDGRKIFSSNFSAFPTANYSPRRRSG